MKSVLLKVAFATFASVLLCAVPQVSLSAPASPDPFTVRQPNGLEIKLRMRGDEWFSWEETTDGRPVLKDPKTGFYNYARQTGQGDLVMTGKRVGVDQPDTKPFDVRPKEHEHRKIKENQTLASRSAAVSSGTGLVPLIFANFSDTTPSVSATTISNVLFSTQAGANSMANYYAEVSYGKFTVAAGPSGVQNWVNVPNTQAFYGGNQGTWKDTNAALFVRHAVQAAITAGYDFSPYDQDGDGKVDVVNLVHTGAGEEAGGGVNTIWSHRFSLSDAGLTPVTTPNGLVVDDYVIQPELRGDGSLGLPMTVGVFVHEHGHALGLPDLYDTDYSSCGIGNWSGMSFGANLQSGTMPAHFDPWCKAKLGWLTPINYTLNYGDVQFPHAAGTAFAARLWKDGIVGSQYYLVENRFRTNFDSALPSDGLLIWHIDESKTGNAREWYPISVGGAPANTNNGNFLVRLVQADGLFQLDITNKNGALPVSQRQNQGDAGDPFPGTSNNRVFGTNTWPNSASYNVGITPGYNSYVIVSNISDPGPIMTADLYTRSPNSGPYVEWRNIAGVVPPYEWATFSKLGEFNPVVIKALPGVVGTPLKQVQLYINRGSDGQWWDFVGHTWITNPVSSNVDISGYAQSGLTLAYQNNLPAGTNLLNGTYTFIVRVINTSDIVTELQMPMVAVHKPEVTLSLNDNAIVNTLTNFNAVATEESGIGIQRVEIAVYYDTEAHDIGTSDRWYWDGYGWTTTPMWLGADFGGNPAQATLLYPIGPDSSYLLTGRQYSIAARAIDALGGTATNEISVMYDTGTPPTVYWRYGSSGNWSDPANWIPYGIPGAGSHVAINAPGDYTVTVSGDINVASLRVGRGIGLSKQELVILSGRSLTVGASDTNKFFGTGLLVQGGNLFGGKVRFYPSSKWTWTNGTMGANAELDVNSALSIEGPADKGFTYGSYLVNRGTLSWRDTGSIIGGGGATITNAGLVSLEGNATLFYNNSGSQTVFINGPFGTIRKTTSTTNVFSPDYGGWNFANYGTVDIRAGMLNLRNAPKTLFAGTITGAGILRSEGGMLTLGGNVAFNAGTLQLWGDMLGAGAFTGAGVFDWQAGTIGWSARITNGPSVQWLFSPGAYKYLTGGSIFQQNGPTRVTDPVTIILSQGSVFNNAGLFQIVTNTTFYYDNSGSSPAFVNQPGGILEKTSTNVATFHQDYGGVRFSNDGLVDVQEGSLRFGGGGGPSTGEFRTAGSTYIDFIANTQTFTNGVTLTGTGTVRLLGGRVDANSGPGSIVLQSIFEVSTNGTLGGTALWTGTGAMNWNAGAIYAAATIGSGLTMNITGSAQRWLEGARLVNEGTINWLGDGLLITGYGSLITNKALFHAQGNATLYYNNAGAYTAFYNDPGAVFKKSGADTITFSPDYSGVAFHNRGTLEIADGLLLMRNATKVFYDGSTVTGAGRVKNADGTLTLSGVVNLNGGTIENARDLNGVGGLSGNGTLEWSAGTISAASRLTNGANVQLLITPGGNKWFGGGSIIQQHGNTVVTEPGFVTFSQGSTFMNAGLFQVVTNTTFYYDNSGGYSWFNNLPSGIFRKTTTNTVFFHWDYTGIKFKNDGLVDAQAGTLQFGGGGGPSSGEYHADAGALIEMVAQTQTLADGASITGAGTTRLRGGRVDGDNTNGVVTLTGTMEVSTNGALGGISKFAGTGSLNWNAGYIYAQLTLQTGLTMNITGSAPRWLEFGRVVNEATVNWFDDGDLWTGYGVTFTNLGIFHAQGNAAIHYNNGGGYTGFYNEPGATFRKSGATTNVFADTYSGMAFYNRGTVDVQEGMLRLRNATKGLRDGGSISGAGLFRSENGLLNLAGTTTFNGGTLQLAGDMNGAGNFAGTGTLDWNAGAIYSLQFTNGASMQLSITPGGGKWMGGGTVWRQDGPTIVTDPGTVTLSQGAVFSNAGLFDVRADTSFAYDNSGSYPWFYNLAGGTVRRSESNGTAAFVDWYGGIRFNNEGAIDLRTGTLALNVPNTTGSLAAWTVALGGTNQTEFARASFSGSAALAGALTVVTTNGYTPAEGDVFDLVTYGSHSGQFTAVNLPPLPYALQWKVDYSANALRLRVEKAHVLANPGAPLNGQLSLTFTGPTAGSAVLQTSTNLVDWLSIETNAPFTGSFQFTDSDATSSNKFYRVLIVP